MLKSFEKWNYEELDLAFGYKRVFTPFPVLEDWLNEATQLNLAAADIAMAEKQRQKLVLSVDGYNEEELKMQFITPILNIVDLNIYNKYKLFAQRKISATITKTDGQTDILNGRVEAMVARGEVEPRHPFFFIHEYKPQRKSTADPLGQVVAAMITAQITNKDDKPIYGLYVRGELWNFVVLEGKTYSQSQSYDATKANDLKLILQALFWIKQHIEHRIDTENLK